MIFLVGEDFVLSVARSTEEANSVCEPFDAEAANSLFFDDAGRQLVPEFPNRNTTRFLGMRVDDDPGPYMLRPSGDTGSLIVQIFEGGLTLDPNPWFASLEDVKAHLRAHGHPSI